MTTTDTSSVRRFASPTCGIARDSGAGEGHGTSAPALARACLHERFLAPVLTLTTLGCLGLAWVSTRAGVQGWPLALAYSLAYVAGGYLPARVARAFLRGRRLHAALPVLLAAAGAAGIGLPFEGATLLFVLSLSHVLQAYAFERTRRPVRSLLNLRATHALSHRGPETRLSPIQEIAPAEILIVRPGETIPLEGTLIEDVSAIDDSMLTGESMSVRKKSGDDAGQIYLVAVLVASALLFVIPWIIFGEGFHGAFYRAMTLMVVASPCALLLNRPVTILSAIGGAARRGILFQGGAHLERTADVRLVAFEKSGILTIGRPRVTDVLLDSERFPYASTTAPAVMELLRVAAAAESKSEHPLARAIVESAHARRLGIPEATAVASTRGKGVVALVGDRMIGVGNIAFFREMRAEGLELMLPRVASLQDEGKTCVLVGEIRPPEHIARILGAIAIADIIRDDAPHVVRRLRQIGVDHIVMLTGDNLPVAAAIGRETGITEIRADLRPDEKAKALRALKSLGNVAIVGRATGDASAFAAADVGIAIGAGGTEATADVIITGDRLSNVTGALDIARRSRRVGRQNLTFALGIMLVMVAAALWGQVSLTTAVIAAEGSAMIVCLSALRLLRSPPEPGDEA